MIIIINRGLGFIFVCQKLYFDIEFQSMKEQRWAFELRNTAFVLSFFTMGAKSFHIKSNKAA